MLVAGRLHVPVAIGLVTLLLCQCGGRSALPQGDGTGPLIVCNHNGDCFDGNLCVTKACIEGYCSTVATKTCDDGDPCTSDLCDPATGACYFPLKVHDNDGDGYLGHLPGTQAGAPGSCGNDCNDSNAAVYPGAPELCDGLDNNCDGRIDEGVNVYRTMGTAVRVTDDTFSEAGPRGFVFNGSYFGLTLTGKKGDVRFQGYFTGFDISGNRVVPITNVSQTSNDSYGGPLLWTGSVFASAWEVRGEHGYDIYFNQFDVNGKKLGPDLRISNGAGFSVEPSVLWDDTNYWIAWSDDNGGNLNRIFGRKVSADGQFVGEVQALTNLMSDARSPTLLQSPNSSLLLYLSANSQRLTAQLLGSDMTPSGSSIYLSDTGASDYSADWVGDRYVIVWSTQLELPGNAIWAASVDAAGGLVQSAQTITSGANFARKPSLLSLGDRFALAWTDDRQSFSHYGVRFATYSTNFVALVTVQTLAETAYNCIQPGLANGGAGLGLLYRERTYGQVGYPFFVPLTCGP